LQSLFVGVAVFWGAGFRPATAAIKRDSGQNLLMESKVPTAKVRWKESEVSRLIRAHKKEGVQVCVEIRPDGSLVAMPRDASSGDDSTAEAELERWRKKNRDAA